VGKKHKNAIRTGGESGQGCRTASGRLLFDTREVQQEIFTEVISHSSYSFYIFWPYYFLTMLCDRNVLYMK